MSADVDRLTFRAVDDADLDAIAAMEAASYPADEAASAATLRARATDAREFFMVATLDGAVVAYVCGTLTARDALDAATMTNHDPLGRTLCVHSVCASPSARRRDFGGAALRRYVDDWIGFADDRRDARVFGDARDQVLTIRLLCKRALIEFYERRGGFRCLGESSVTHGRDAWFECARHRDEDEAPPRGVK